MRHRAHHGYRRAEQNPRCPVCRGYITDGFVRHNGQRTHWECWQADSEQPDIVSGRGAYAELEAQEVA